MSEMKAGRASQAKEDIVIFEQIIDGYVADGNRQALEQLRGFISEVGIGFLYKPFPSTVLAQDCLEKIAYIDKAIGKTT